MSHRILVIASLLVLVACPKERKRPTGPSFEERLAAAKAPPPAPPPPPPAPTIARADVVGTWVCRGSKAYTFADDGTFSVEPDTGKVGTWKLTGNTLGIADDKGKLGFVVDIEKKRRTTKMTIGSVDLSERRDYLCWTGANSEIYANFYKNEPVPEEKRHEALVGYWYNGEGVELNRDGSYAYHGPDCDRGGWVFDGKKLVLDDDSCGKMKWQVASIETQILRLKDNVLFRQHREKASVKTSSSK